MTDPARTPKFESGFVCVRVTPSAPVRACRWASSIPAVPLVSKQPPSGDGWVHEVKHDGYRLQIHAGAGRVRLYTINGADWTDRYPLIVEEARRIKKPAVIDAEVICTDKEGRADFDRLHSRCFEQEAIACAFDLLRLDGDDPRRLPLSERKGDAAEAAAAV